MTLFNKVSNFIREAFTSPTELERNRREFDKKRALKNIHMEKVVFNVVISCKTTDHVQSCREWIQYMLGRGIINVVMYEGLEKAIDIKEEELSVIRPPRKTLPHLQERAERISKYDKTRHLKVVRVHEIV